jgi:4-amino-4-deoxy-L-arabinose transferase-like glycosyltransferase
VLVQTAMGVGGAMLLARSARRHLGETAKLPAMLFALVYFNSLVAVYGGFQLETMQCFFAILAGGAAMEALSAKRCARDAFVVGLAAGCAAMLKPTGGAVLAAFAIAATVGWHRTPLILLRHVIAVACGLAIPVAVTLAYLLGTDTLHEMPALYRQIARYAAATPFEWFDLVKPAIVIVILPSRCSVRGWVGRRDRIDATPPRTIIIFLVAWLALEFIGILAQRRMYPYHFLPLAPPAGVALRGHSTPRTSHRLAGALLPAAVASLVAGRNSHLSSTRETTPLRRPRIPPRHAQPAIASGRTGWPAR